MGLGSCPGAGASGLVAAGGGAGWPEPHRPRARWGLRAGRDLAGGSLALGQQRIVEIARALCLGPTLLLLDEPAAGLRHQEKQALGDLLRRLRQEGLGILPVEHDIDFVMGLADRLVVMNFGAQLSEGAPDTGSRDPAVVDAYPGSAA